MFNCASEESIYNTQNQHEPEHMQDLLQNDTNMSGTQKQKTKQNKKKKKKKNKTLLEVSTTVIEKRDERRRACA